MIPIAMHMTFVSKINLMNKYFFILHYETILNGETPLSCQENNDYRAFDTYDCRKDRHAFQFLFASFRTIE